MIYSFFHIFFILIICGAAVVGVDAQTADKEELPKGIIESLVKSRIDREKKDFQELLERGDEAAKLSDELDKSFVQNKRLTADDLKKLERLEKLSKKIREELGASNSDEYTSTGKNADNSDDEKISSLSDAVNKLKNVSRKLSDELKKTTRYTVSAAAIQTSNAVLKIVRFIRQDKN